MNPYAAQVIEDWRALEEETVKKELDKLKTEKDLCFGEILALVELDSFQKYSWGYFYTTWLYAKKLESLYERAVEEILDEEREDILANQSRACKIRCKRIFKMILKLKESLTPSKTPGRVEFLNKTNKQWIDSIQFKDSFTCGKYIRFGTFFKYYISRMKDDPQKQNVQNDWVYAYKRLSPILNTPFIHIRPNNVLACLSGLSDGNKRRCISIYRHLDKYAYEIKLIPRRYADTIHLKRPNYLSLHEKALSDAQIENLWRHSGNWDVDAALTLIYTGLSPSEFLHVKKEDVDETFLTVRSGTKIAANRKIPIHPRCKKLIKQTFEERDKHIPYVIPFLDQSRQLREKIGFVCEEYLGDSSSPLDLRRTFKYRLLQKNVPLAAVGSLCGTNTSLIKEYERTYRHFPVEQLEEWIQLVA